MPISMEVTPKRTSSQPFQGGPVKEKKPTTAHSAPIDGDPALKKTNSQPFRVGPPGPRTIKGNTLSAGSKGEGWLGPSEGNRKGKGKVVAESDMEEACPSRGKAKAVIAHGVLETQGKGKEKPAGGKEDTVAGGQQAKERAAEDILDTQESLEEAHGQSQQRGPTTACTTCSKSHARSCACPTAETTQIVEEGKCLTEEPCTHCTGRFTCVVRRNSACKMCNWSKVSCSFVNRQGTQRAQSVIWKAGLDGTKQLTKLMTRKHRQESPIASTTTTNNANESGEVSSPPPKRQHQWPSMAKREPLSAGPSQPVLVHPSTRTAEAVSGRWPPLSELLLLSHTKAYNIVSGFDCVLITGHCRASLPYIVPQSIPPSGSPSLGNVNISPQALTEAYNEFQRENANLWSRMDTLEIGMTTIFEEVKRFLELGQSQLRFLFDNRELGHSDGAEMNVQFPTDDNSPWEQASGVASAEHRAGSASGDNDAMNVIDGLATPPGTPPAAAQNSIFSSSPTPHGFSVPPAFPKSPTLIPRQLMPSEWTPSPGRELLCQFEELPEEGAEVTAETKNGKEEMEGVEIGSHI